MDAYTKSRFLSLYCMVMADGIVQAKELETLYRIGRERYDLSPEDITQCVSTAGSSFVAPDSIEDCISILYEMAEIAWADCEIDDSERSLLKKYAVRLGFEKDKAEEVADFMLEQVKNKVSLKEIISQIN